MSELQKFVCEKLGLIPGNYIGIANLIENSFIPDNLSILAEYGIPISAIRKIEKYLPHDINQDDILEYIKANKLVEEVELIEYERGKFMQNLP